MLDPWTTKLVTPPLKFLARLAEQMGISPDQITLAGFLTGMAAVPMLYLQEYTTALVLILINRILDGMDGVLARMSTPTIAGGFLDITLDFIFYPAVVFGFALADPGTNALAATALIFSFIGTGSSFLAFAAMAEKAHIKCVTYPHKSLYYLGGITEGTETIILFILMCLFPDRFTLMAWGFTGLCWLTTILRVMGGYLTLKKATPAEQYRKFL
jgi:phosphatidylglycerophosphate synthase